MPARVKALLRPIIPATIHSRWQRFRFDREQANARGQSLETVFNEIYERKIWSPNPEDGRFHSGPGSLPNVTAGYESFVADYINQRPKIQTLVDFGCGDFQVSQRILNRLDRPIMYIGCDIASKVVADNASRFNDPGRVEFRHLDVSQDELPSAEIVTIREVFQHLSNETISRSLANLRKNFEIAIVTEAVPIAPSQPNLDIVSGYRTRDGLNSGVFLDAPPFNLSVENSFEQPASETEIYRTLVVRL